MSPEDFCSEVRAVLLAPRAGSECTLGTLLSSSWGGDQATCCCLQPQHTIQKGVVGYTSNSHGREGQGIKTAASAEPSPYIKSVAKNWMSLLAKWGYYHRKSLYYFKPLHFTTYSFCAGAEVAPAGKLNFYKQMCASTACLHFLPDTAAPTKRCSWGWTFSSWSLYL